MKKSKLKHSFCYYFYDSQLSLATSGCRAILRSRLEVLDREKSKDVLESCAMFTVTHFCVSQALNAILTSSSPPFLSVLHYLPAVLSEYVSLTSKGNTIGQSISGNEILAHTTISLTSLPTIKCVCSRRTVAPVN